MLFGRLSGKSVAAGFLAGLVFTLALEWCGVLVLARMHKKSPEELSKTLKKPPVPSALDADYSLSLETLEGTAFDFATLKGKTVFLCFWNPDCATCEAELPSIQKLYEKVAPDGVAFVLATVAGSQQDATNLATEYKLTVPVYRVQNKLCDLYKTSVPSAFVLSPQGKVAFRHEGSAQWDDDSVVAFLRSLGPAK